MMKKEMEKFYWRLLLLSSLTTLTCSKKMDFEINKTWDNKPIGHDPIRIYLYPEGDKIVMEINAPFFNDPPAPEGEAGKPFNKLWEYEVVEAFFLGKEEKYLEVEFSPYGQHLLLLLSGRKNAIKMCLPVEYTASINGQKWHGIARIPKSYFPPNVNMLNAYAIHGSNESRTYEALYPVPEGHFDYPDFHRLEFFRYIDFSKFLPDSHPLSEVWIDALEKSSKGEKLVCSEE